MTVTKYLTVTKRPTLAEQIAEREARVSELARCATRNPSSVAVVTLESGLVRVERTNLAQGATSRPWTGERSAWDDALSAWAR